ncbi:MAG: LEA type 2 family protein [Desulfobacterium sp.]|nr:LEA type 2 family protein [Desulfobacterium sp.]
MIRINGFLLLPFLLLFGFGCAALQQGYETPQVTISSFEALPSQGVIPRFKIGMHIINPNRTPLDLKGVSYTISLEGSKVLTGVSNQLPRIEAYGEGDVVLNASVDFFSSMILLKDLIQDQKNDNIYYSFAAKLDIGSLYPFIRVTKQGKISLNQLLEK